MKRNARTLTVLTSSLALATLMAGLAPATHAASTVTAPTETAASADDAPSTSRKATKAPLLKGGTCPKEVPLGLVRLAGPAGTTLTARVRKVGATKLLTVVSGSGRIGGVEIRPRDVSGELTLGRKSMTGSITINLERHRKVVRTWVQSVIVTAQPTNCDWTGSVALRATGVGASLDMRGPLDDDGGYELRGSGKVGLSRTSVPVTGWLRSPNKPGFDDATRRMVRSKSTTWRISGSTKRDVRIPGARIQDVSLNMTQAASVVGGTATVQLEAPRLTAPARLDVAGSDTWAARVDGSNRRVWVVPNTEGLVVRTKELVGAIGVRAGRPLWTLHAPGAVKVGTLDYVTEVGFTGPLSYTVQAEAAVGTILGMPEQRRFAGGRTQLTITPKGITGALTVNTRDRLFLIMTQGWVTSTDYALIPVAGEGWSFTDVVSYGMRAGKGMIRLTGPVVDGGVNLKASGNMEISDTLVPVKGYYRRSSFTDGSTPVWSLAAFPDQAQGGRIPLDGGAGLVGGLIVFNGPGAQPTSTIDDSAATGPMAVQPADTSDDSTSSSDSATTVSISGSTTVQLSDSDDDTFYLPVDYVYTDPDNWTATAAGTTPSNVYSPFTGLAIPETDFSGTVTDTDGVQTWDVDITMQEWQDFSVGVDFQGAFSIANYCTLGDECPPDSTDDSNTIYLSGQSTFTFDDSSIPTLYATGALVSDGSWARWDAVATEPVTFDDITMDNAEVTIWKGTQGDANPDLILPDLSDLNGDNGMSLEFCADFVVTVPDVATLDTNGCAEYSPDGVVMGQLNTGGSVEPGSYNGIYVESATLSGWTWNGLDTTETVFLNGVEIAAETDVNYLTGAVVVPGTVMHDFGTGTSSDTTITVEGSFTDESDFTLDGTIPVNLSGSGFTLQEILISIAKAGDDFSLQFDADCDVVISGNHFPLDVYIGYESSDAETITVGLTATGTQSTSNEGTMDFVTLIPTGDFEPTNASLVDGSFDGALPSNIPNDGGFERSSTPGNLVSNGDFEDDMNLNVITNGDFEDGSIGNILDNGDFESTNLLVNGDFEENGGSLLGWTTTSSSFAASTAEGTAVGPDDEGDYIAVLTNSSASSNTTGGLSQVIPTPMDNDVISVSAWASSNGSSATSFHIQLAGTGCSSTFSVAGASISAPVGSWVEATVGATVPKGCDSVTVTLVPETKGGSVQLDAVEFSITDAGAAAALPTVWRPNLVATFDSLATSPLMPGYSSGVVINSTYPGTLQSNNNYSWMTYSDTTGYTAGDFDVSYKVYFIGNSGNNSQDANFGFWLDGDYSTMDGYCFALHSNDGNGGFRQDCNGSNKSLTKISKVSRSTWYEVRLTAVDGTVTAYVTDVDSNELVVTSSIDVTTPPGGVFGQVRSQGNADNGFLWDDLTIYSLANKTGDQDTVYAPNKVMYGDGLAHTGDGYAALTANGISGAPFQYSTGETPEQGTTYAYTTWMRASSGTVSGTITLAATGGDADESASNTFTVGTQWAQVGVDLSVLDDDHTDLRPGVTITSTGSGQLYLDDQILQEVPWSPVGSTVVAVTSNEAYSGTNALTVLDYSQGSQVEYDFGLPPAAGSQVKVTAWVMTPGQPVSADLRISESAGSTKSSFSVNGTWQQITVSRTMQGGTSDLLAVLDINGGQAAPIYLDDVTVTVEGTDSSQTGDVGAPPSPTGWTSEQTCSGATADDTAVTSSSTNEAHGGSGSMMLAPDSGCTLTDTWVTDDTPSIGATWNSTVWLSGSSGASATVTLSSGQNSVKQNVSVPGSYQPLDLSLPISKTAGPLTLSVAVSGATAYVDDVSIVQTGLTLVDDWQESTTGSYVGVFGVDDSAAAYDGDGYLYLANTGNSTAEVYLDDDSYTPVVGTAHEMSFWYRSLAGSGNGVATLETLDASGNVLDSYSVNFPAAPSSTWQFVYLSLPITKSTAVTMRTQIGMPGGATFAVDDVESRDVTSWSAVQPQSGGKASITIIDEVSDAANGMNYLLTITSAAGGGMGDTITVDTDGDAIAVTAGETYQMQAYIRSTTGASVNGTMSLATGAGDRTSVNFTATSDWAPIELELTATKSASSLIPQIVLAGAGQLDIDEITLIPVLIEQSDPWSPLGGGVTWQVVQDPVNAHDSSYGLMKFTATNPNTGVQHAVDQSANVGDEFSVNAWVRSSSSTPVSGEVQVTTVGGTNELWRQPFTADGTWQSVSIPMTIAESGHTSFEVAVLASTTDVMLYLDDVTMQQNQWTASAGTTQTIVYDGGDAQSGTSYLELSYTGSGSGSTYYDMPASEDIGNVYAAGTTWIVTAYLKSSSASALATGQLSLGDPASTATPQGFSVGAEWTAVTASYTVGSGDLDDLRVQVYVAGSSVPVDVDSITISDGTPAPDGITTPLPHPDSGYLYLWDEAFGIPGAHLWAASAQVDFSDGVPGLGVSATL